jgi:hypothetical protein
MRIENGVVFKRPDTDIIDADPAPFWRIPPTPSGVKKKVFRWGCPLTLLLGMISYISFANLLDLRYQYKTIKAIGSILGNQLRRLHSSNGEVGVSDAGKPHENQSTPVPTPTGYGDLTIIVGTVPAQTLEIRYWSYYGKLLAETIASELQARSYYGGEFIDHGRATLMLDVKVAPPVFPRGLLETDKSCCLASELSFSENGIALDSPTHKEMCGAGPTKTLACKNAITKYREFLYRWVTDTLEDLDKSRREP